MFLRKFAPFCVVRRERSTSGNVWRTLAAEHVGSPQKEGEVFRDYRRAPHRDIMFDLDAGTMVTRSVTLSMILDRGEKYQA